MRNRRLSTMGYLYLENDVFKTEIKVFTYPCLKVQGKKMIREGDNMRVGIDARGRFGIVVPV